MKDVATVAVIDACQKTTKECDKDELTFLCDKSELVEYEAVGKCCVWCSESEESSPRGISAHGVFCADIIRRASPSPPRLAIYAVGCPSCSQIDEAYVALAIEKAVQANVNVISISLMRTLPSRFVDEDQPDLHVRDLAALDAMVYDALVVVSAGNYGEFGLATVQKSAPWCLCVGSSTSYKRFKTKITFVTNASFALPELEGYSNSMVNTTKWKRVRKKGEIKDKPCVMYVEGTSIVIEEADKVITTNPMSLVFISEETSNEISSNIDRVAKDTDNTGILAASFVSSLRTDFNHPSVSKISGRGPCCFYKDYMKPDLCAPGEEIVASLLPDVSLEGDYEIPYTARYTVVSGTSFATPYVAAGVAAIMAEKKFSVSATISAAITTADRMHGSDSIGFEFAYGAGVFNSKKAMRPGLVYEEEVKSFDEYVLGDKIPHCNLNLPYFSATFPLRSGKWSCSFPRKLKSVEKGRCTYIAEVVVHATTLSMPVESIKISVNPQRLIFEDLDEEQQFLLNVDLPHTESEKAYAIVSSSLIWTNEDDVKLVVKSPIILSSKDTSVLLLDRQTLQR